MTVIVEPVETSVARHDAELLLSVAGRLSDPVVVAAVRALAVNLSAGVMLSGADEWVTPAQAGALLHVSRQYIDKLVADGRLTVQNKPGSRHRLIAVAELMELERRRRGDNVAAAALVGDMIDAGLDY